MKLPQIITSLLDTDLYKFGMNNLMYHKYKNYTGTYVFKCRNDDVYFTEEMYTEICAQLQAACKLRFTAKEIAYLKSLGCYRTSFIRFLKNWKPDYNLLTTSLSLLKETNNLNISATGKLPEVMMFEIYVLEIVNEVYFRMHPRYSYDILLASAKERLDAKIEAFKEGKYTFKFAEFGCRRRLGKEWEDEVVRRFATETNNMVGTSNVYLAMKYNLTPIGTYAHELVEMYQGVHRDHLAFGNAYALDDWYKEYKGKFGTALTDTLTTDVFLLDFNKDMLNKFSGVRHDSGDPYEWGDKMITHFVKNGCDPMTKTLLFSDSLDFGKAQNLQEYFHNKAKVAFGIGTFVANDTRAGALNIVMKLQKVNGLDVAKISDCQGKTMCLSNTYVNTLQAEIDTRIRG